LYDTPQQAERKQRRQAVQNEEEDPKIGNQLRTLILVFLVMVLFMFGTHCTWVTSNAYSSPSVVLASQNPDGTRNILDDFREAYYWLRTNTDEDARYSRFGVYIFSFDFLF